MHVFNGVLHKRHKLSWIPKEHEIRDKDSFKRSIIRMLKMSDFTPWTTRYSRLRQIAQAKIVITKLIRGNMLMPWIVSNIDLPAKPVFLLRHPLSTCLSQLKAFQTENNILNDEAQSILEKLFPGQKSETLQIEERLITWFLNNVSTLTNYEALKKVHIIFYEDLIINPKTELVRLNEEVENINIQNIGPNIYRKPSRTDFKNDLLDNPEEQLRKSFEKLDDTVFARVAEIFNYFDFKIYDPRRPYPNKKEWLAQIENVN